MSKLNNPDNNPDKVSASEKLTPEQIQNWRNILCGMIGPYALIMPDADIQRFRDRMQVAVGDPQNAE